MSFVRFVGFFHDRDYAPFGDVAYDGEVFFSLRDATNKLRARAASNGQRCDVAYTVAWNGMVATHAYATDPGVFFAVTGDAYIDLYPVSPDRGHRGWGVVGEPAYRIRFGPRGGVCCESF